MQGFRALGLGFRVQWLRVLWFSGFSVYAAWACRIVPKLMAGGPFFRSDGYYGKLSY